MFRPRLSKGDALGRAHPGVPDTGLLAAACLVLHARSPPAAPQPLSPAPHFSSGLFIVRLNKTLKEKAFEQVFYKAECFEDCAVPPARRRRRRMLEEMRSPGASQRRQICGRGQASCWEGWGVKALLDPTIVSGRGWGCRAAGGSGCCPGGSIGAVRGSGNAGSGVFRGVTQLLISLGG